MAGSGLCLSLCSPHRCDSKVLEGKEHLLMRQTGCQARLCRGNTGTLPASPHAHRVAFELPCNVFTGTGELPESLMLGGGPQAIPAYAIAPALPGRGIVLTVSRDRIYKPAVPALTPAMSCPLTHQHITGQNAHSESQTTGGILFSWQPLPCSS